MKRLLFLLLLASAAEAQTVVNPSFETAPVPTGTWNSGVVPGWKLVGNGGLWQPLGVLLPVADGPTIAWLNVGTLTQDLGVAPRLNTTYKLTIQIGHRTDGLTGAYEIALTDAGAAFCSTSANSSTIPSGTFAPVSISCPIGASQPVGNLGIMIAGQSGQVDFDNVVLTATPNLVPQIQTFALNAHLRYCSACDGSDDSTTGLNVLAGSQIQVFQGMASEGLYTLNATGDVTGTAGLTMNTGPIVLNVVVLSPTGTPLPCPAIPNTPPNTCFQITLDPIYLGSFSGLNWILRLDATTAGPRGSQEWLQ